MPDSGAPLKMNLRPSATKIRGIQQTSERLIGFLEWGADFILALARDASLLARDDGPRGTDRRSRLTITARLTTGRFCLAVNRNKLASANNLRRWV